MSGGMIDRRRIPTSGLKSRLGRVPFPVWALAVCLLAAAAGGMALDDYGISTDEGYQRGTGRVNLDYILGRSDALLTYEDRYYGVAFELPLLLAERALGLEDSRSIYLLRHLLTHLCFIAGAFFAGLLAWRMTGSRGLALFALLLFLLHPRLYAHSFINSKDLPFLSMLMMALYFTHRAFRRDTLGAFILCGVAIGLLSNIRIMGLLMLFPAVIAMRGLDFGYEFRRPERRRHLLLTTGGFVLAAAVTLYAAWPWLWGDPLARFIEAITLPANLDNFGSALFRGELVFFQSPPWDYIPVWMSITTPPAGLLLALAGGAAALYRGLSRPRDSLRNGPPRFDLLLLACLILPVIAVIALDSTLYNGWRQMYFLYVPLCLLAVVGLQRLVEAAGQVRLRLGRLPGGRGISGGPAAVRGLLYAAAAIALLSIAVQMLQLHPFQSLYFNFLADRQTPEQLNNQYSMHYYKNVYRAGLEYLLERYPEGALRVYLQTNRDSGGILPAAQRQRLRVRYSGNDAPPDFFITQFPKFPVSGGETALFPPSLHTIEVYRNTVLTVAALDLSLVDDATASRYRQRYREAVAGELLIDSEVAVYRQGRTLNWVIESCNPQEWGVGFNLWLYPADAQRLSRHRQHYGFTYEEIGRLTYPLLRFGGKCFAQAALPPYDLARIRTRINRFDPATGQKTGTWVGHYYPGLPEVLDAIGRQRESEPPPAADPQWEVYQDNNRLLYAKAGCAPADREAWFFLHLTPANPGDLPGDRREHGYDNLDFRFDWRGLEVGGECIAVVPLPDYPITAIATGQYTAAGRLWETTLPVSESNSRTD